MKIADVKANAFAMPLTSPAFPKGPYRFINREFLVISSTFAREPLLAIPLVFGILVALGALFLRLNGIAVLLEHIADDFRTFHCNRERVPLSQMIRTRIVRPVRLHHRDGSKIEVGVAVRAALGKLFDGLRRQAN